MEPNRSEADVTKATKPKKKIKPSSIVWGAIAFLLVVLIVYFFVTQALGGIPNFFGFSIVRIVTPSMESKIPTGSYVLIRHVDPEDIREKDIITFYTDDPDPQVAGWTITHRVVGITTDADGKILFTTKGDNNALEDAYPARADALVGRYVKNVIFLTALANLFKTKAGLAVSLVIPMFLICQIILSEMTKKTKKKREDYIRERVAEELAEALRKQQSDRQNQAKTESPDGILNDITDRKEV